MKPLGAAKIFPLPEIEIASKDFAERLTQTVRRSQQYLLSLQKPDGHWCGELMVDSTLCSDVILFCHWAQEAGGALEHKCAQHIRRMQLPDGGWNIFQGGPSEINASVKAYFALKLAGDSPDAPWMRDARANILRLGGIPKMNTYAKLYLALLGQFPWKYLPTIPVEIVAFPKWLFFNLWEVSSWTRAMIVPLAIINHFKPVTELPPEKHLHELYPVGSEGDDFTLARDRKYFFSWRNFFLRCDTLLKIYEKIPFHPLRPLALKAAERWMVARMGPESEGLAAIFPAMLNAVIALRALGYAKDHPVYTKAWKDFEGLFVDEPENFRIQPCLSPVWDTAITTIALSESGVPSTDSRIARATKWLLEQEVRFAGDWKHRVYGVEPSGWAFEYGNDYYPDTDDTMMVLMALRSAGVDPQSEVFSRALRWLMAFQCKDGGWGAFDKDVTRHWLEDVPFADHNAILDPTCSDLTARVLELLGYLGWKREHPQIVRALAYLRRTQERDGSWYGRWGVNYIYGTWQALRGLSAIGEDMTQDWILRARDWLESCQNDDGGWGETCATYDDPDLKGQGPSTASQTAWALMGLIACKDADRDSLRRGIRYLIQNQEEDGSWTEDETTGTGFPCVFYLRYDMYRNNWPLLALADWRKMQRL
ncbi:MAG: squalene--hopene cyclase [Chthoniobacterales bacterium]